MDAYSYLFRGYVFANAQTGNMLLFGVNFADGDFSNAVKYLWPVLAFAIGIVISDIINGKRDFIKIHWRQIAVLIEIIILIIVAFLPENYNSLANILTSFACGIQVESFRKIHGNSIATTMCIGNLRTATNNLVKFFSSREKGYLRKAFLYYGIIVMFVSGAIIESHLIKIFGEKAILLSPVLLAAALIIMFSKIDDDKKNLSMEKDE